MDMALIPGILGAITGAVALILQFRKANTEEKLSSSQIAEKITSAAGSLMEKLQAQNAKLEAQIIKLEAQITLMEASMKSMELKLAKSDREVQVLRRGVNKLIAQIRKLGEEPCWIPDDL